MRNTRTLCLMAVVVVLLASAAVRFYRLDKPHGYIFDEVYYAKDAKAIVDGRLGPKTDYHWMPGDEVSWPHPYYGKLAIAVGVALFGNDEFGWRFMAALAGLATICVVYPLARRLGLRREWALLALVLAAVDFLGIAQSRIATLDVFVGFWSVLTIYLALRYVQSRGRLLWLALTGVSAGLALGSKWSGAFAIVAAIVLILLLWRRVRPAIITPALAEGEGLEEDPTKTDSESRATAASERKADKASPADPAGGTPRGFRARRGGGPQSGGTLVSRSLPAAVLLPIVFLVLLPVGLYVASYGFYFAHGHGWADWWELHRQMWTFSAHLKAKHTYASLAPTWILDIRPVWYYFKEQAAHYYGVISFGHPFLWWAATLALVALPVTAIMDRRRELVLPSLIVALLYFPWFATSRTSFIYYMTPVAPFLAILVAVGLARLAGQRPDLDLAEAPAGAVSTNGGPRVAGAGAKIGGRALGYASAGFAACAFLAASGWYYIGQAVSFVFYDLPARIAPAVGIAVSCLAGSIVLVALTYAAVRPSAKPVWRYLAWCFAGACAGLLVAFAPIILDYPVTPEEFYRLMWLPSWI